MGIPHIFLQSEPSTSREKCTEFQELNYTLCHITLSIIEFISKKKVEKLLYFINGISFTSKNHI